MLRLLSGSQLFEAIFREPSPLFATCARVRPKAFSELFTLRPACAYRVAWSNAAGAASPCSEFKRQPELELTRGASIALHKRHAAAKLHLV